MNWNKPTDAVIRAYALRLLRAGVLLSNIPGELMREFGITAARAGRLAGEAWTQHGLTPGEGEVSEGK